MNSIRRHSGFSLIEVMLATGILGIGLVLIAMVFPVGIKLTSVATDRTISAVVADEAFAKIRLYGLSNPADWPIADPALGFTDYRYATAYRVGTDGVPMTPDDIPLNAGWSEFQYPSVDLPPSEQKYFHWSALCRTLSDTEMQVVVFVTRRAAIFATYREYDPVSDTVDTTSLWPCPVPLQITPIGPRTIEMTSSAEIDYVREGGIIVGNSTGTIYIIDELIDVDPDPGIEEIQIRLSANWLEPAASPAVWVVPPAVGSSRDPLVGILQKTITIN